MATIRATCNDHGNVEMTSQDVTLRICTNDGSGSFVFRCPEDNAPISKPADDRAIKLLKASGCRVEEWSLPQELDERKDGPMIDHDYLLDFHNQIKDDATFNALVELMMDGSYAEHTRTMDAEEIPLDYIPEGDHFKPRDTTEGTGRSPES